MFNKTKKIHCLVLENQELRLRLTQAINLKNEFEKNLNANSKAFRELSQVNHELRKKLAKFDRKRLNGQFISEATELPDHVEKYLREIYE